MPRCNLPKRQHQVRNKKIARIWCLARDLGMKSGKDSEVYLIVESVTGKDSISELNVLELETVVRNLQDALRRQKNKTYQHNTRNRKAGVEYLKTPEQKTLIKDYLEKLTGKLKLNKPDFYLEAICRKTFRKDYQRLNRRETQRLIEALKSIYKRPQEDK